MIYKGLILIATPILFIDSFLNGKNDFLIILFFISLFVLLPIGFIILSGGLYEIAKIQKYYIRNIFYSIFGVLILSFTIVGTLTRSLCDNISSRSGCSFTDIGKINLILHNYITYLLFVLVTILVYLFLNKKLK